MVRWSILDKVPNKTDQLNQDTDFWMKSDFLSDLSPYFKGRVITRCNELIGNEKDLGSFCDCWITVLEQTQLDDDAQLDDDVTSQILETLEYDSHDAIKVPSLSFVTSCR